MLVDILKDYFKNIHSVTYNEFKKFDYVIKEN